MSNQDTRSKRYEQLQREKKLRRKKRSNIYKKPRIKTETYTRETPSDIQDKIQEALQNLEI